MAETGRADRHPTQSNATLSVPNRPQQTAPEYHVASRPESSRIDFGPQRQPLGQLQSTAGPSVGPGAFRQHDRSALEQPYGKCTASR